MGRWREVGAPSRWTRLSSACRGLLPVHLYDLWRQQPRPKPGCSTRPASDNRGLMNACRARQLTGAQHDHAPGSTILNKVLKQIRSQWPRWAIAVDWGTPRFSSAIIFLTSYFGRAMCSLLGHRIFPFIPQHSLPVLALPCRGGRGESEFPWKAQLVLSLRASLSVRARGQEKAFSSGLSLGTSAGGESQLGQNGQKPAGFVPISHSLAP